MSILKTLTATTIYPLLCRNAILLVGLALACLITCRESCAQDRVYPKKDPMASGKIVEINPTAVRINVRNKDQIYELTSVRKIAFDDEPTGLDRARESCLLGQYEQALEEIKKMPAGQIDNPLIQQDIQFYRYYSEGKLSLAGTGDKQAALDGLLALANANPKTHHLYQVSELLGELAVGLGQPDMAIRYLSPLLSAASNEIKAIGVYRLGEVELSQNKVDEARVRFQQLAKAPNNSPEMIRLKSLADVGLAVCENQAGNSQQAVEKLNAMVEKYDSTDHELFARINNAKGACYENLGESNRALLSYLQTDLLFFTDAAAHAEALYHLTQLWPVAGQPSRAADARERLVTQYASSTWAGKLQ